MKPKKLPQNIIDLAFSMKEKGLTRKEIATQIGISYGSIARLFGSERLGIDRTKKEPWTIENLVKLRDNYKELSPKDICLMFNRDRYEIRQLLTHLGWDIPSTYFRKNKEEVIKGILKLKDKYNQKQIAAILGVSSSLVQSLCQTNNIKCSTVRSPMNKAEDFIKKAYREQADSIKKKLGSKYV